MQPRLTDHQRRQKARRRNPPPPCTEQPRRFADIPQHAKDAFRRRLRCAGPDECWPWPCKPGDYGQLRWRDARGRWHIGAHRLAWIIANGADIPPGHLVLHSCDNPRCCNPAHLRIGTHRDNLHDAFARGRMGGRRLRRTSSGSSTPEGRH